MPNKPISIEFTSETDKYEKGLKDAEKATRRLADTVDEVPKATDKMADKAAKDFQRVEDEAGEAGKETAQEFKQNLGESLASGDISSVLTDTLGGLVSSLSGPLAAGAAALAGLGALAFQELQKQAEMTAQLVDTRLQQMRDNLTRNVTELDAALTQSQFEDWAMENLDFMQEINDELHVAGISAEEYARALFEGGPALETMTGKLRAVMEGNKEIITQGDRIKVEYNDAGDAAAELITNIGPMAGTHREAADEMRVYNELLGESARNVQGLDESLRNLPTVIPVEIKYEATGFTGGAFQTAGGGTLRPIYGPRPGQSG